MKSAWLLVGVALVVAFVGCAVYFGVSVLTAPLVIRIEFVPDEPVKIETFRHFFSSNELHIRTNSSVSLVNAREGCAMGLYPGADMYIGDEYMRCSEEELGMCLVTE